MPRSATLHATGSLDIEARDYALPRWLRAGLQAKLVLSFLGMLAMALGASDYSMLCRTRQGLEALGRRQAVQAVRSLSLASAPAMLSRRTTELDRIGQQMIDAGVVAAVRFFDAAGVELASRSALPEQLVGQAMWLDPGSHVGQVRECVAEGGGKVLVLVGAVREPRSQRPIGFLTAFIAQAPTEMAMEQVRLHLVTVGALAVLCCLPFAIALIHKLFNPIRRLVGATRQIIEGDLEARVEVSRSDVIGTLAKLFNRMVLRIKSQQMALAAANRELESKVKERTAQLESANLRLSTEIAEKEEFLRTVSHDLSAPLRNISGMAMMLLRRRETLDAEVIHRLERIQKNVEVETDLIGELLELSRIKTRRLKMENLSVRAVIEEAVGLFDQDLRTHRINLLLEGTFPVLRCERSRLRQVFQNLIDNAIKYMGHSSGRRQIRIGCVEGEAEVEFYVSDSGIGIAAEDLPHVFHVFRRGLNARTADIAGKGVGLSSVKSIVETYDGTVWVDSELNRGSTFHFTIPARHRVDATDPSTAPATAPRAA